jgi:hypothetical protein
MIAWFKNNLGWGGVPFRAVASCNALGNRRGENTLIHEIIKYSIKTLILLHSTNSFIARHIRNVDKREGPEAMDLAHLRAMCTPADSFVSSSLSSVALSF